MALYEIYSSCYLYLFAFFVPVLKIIGILSSEQTGIRNTSSMKFMWMCKITLMANVYDYY